MKYIIFLDMDGVLCDFHRSFFELTSEKLNHGYSPEGFEKKFGSDKFWSLLRERKDFWSNLYKMPDADQLLSFIFSNFSDINIDSYKSDVLFSLSNNDTNFDNFTGYSTESSYNSDNSIKHKRYKRLTYEDVEKSINKYYYTKNHFLWLKVTNLTNKT